MLNVVVEWLRFAYTFLEVILNYLFKPSLIIKSLFCNADTNSQFHQLPNHLAVIYTDKNTISIEALSKLIIHSAHAGISKITLYDPWSYIFSRRELLRKLTHDLIYSASLKQRVDVKFHDSDHFVIHPGFCTTVKILGIEDGRQSIVRACRKLCVECEPEDITVEEISACLAGEHICEPDFLLQIGNLETMAGYSPWVLRITEILRVKSLPNNFSRQQFLSYLHEYSSRDRRVGR